MATLSYCLVLSPYFMKPLPPPNPTHCVQYFEYY